MRVEGWESRLAAEVEATRGRPFSRRSNDCARFVARCIFAVTGERPGRDLLAAYRSGAQAAAVIAQKGGMMALVTEVLGETQGHLHALRGDVVLFRDMGEGVGLEDAIGVCIGAKVAVMSPVGLVFLPLGGAACSWRIG